MNRKVMFLCHTKAQKVAVCKALAARGEIVYAASFDGSMVAPVIMHDGIKWSGYAHGFGVSTRLVKGYKLIDLNEHTAQGGY